MQRLMLCGVNKIVVPDKGKLIMIKVTHKGDFSKTLKYLASSKSALKRIDLDKYGKEGVLALSAATPKDSGKTAESWYYTITKSNGIYKISFCNSNIENNIPIAILIEYGHGTRNGGWVEGKKYIAPAIQPIMDKIAESAWREVTDS